MKFRPGKMGINMNFMFEQLIAPKISAPLLSQRLLMTPPYRRAQSPNRSDQGPESRTKVLFQPSRGRLLIRPGRDRDLNLEISEPSKFESRKSVPKYFGGISRKRADPHSIPTTR